MAQSRSLAVSWVYLLPLWGLYEWGIHASGADMRNAAEVMLKSMFDAAGPGAVWLHRILLVTSLAALYEVYRQQIPYARIYLLVLAESLGWAAVLGPALALVALKSGTSPELGVSTLLSVGAGIYEELIFRLGMVAGGFFILHKALHWESNLSLFLVITISSLLFAQYHHIGAYGEPWNWPAFTFRALAGMILAWMFVFRGLGVTVYLHAFYDILRDLDHLF